MTKLFKYENQLKNFIQQNATILKLRLGNSYHHFTWSIFLWRLNFLIVARCSLLFAGCSLLFDRCSLLLTFSSLLLARYFLLVTFYSLFFARCSLFFRPNYCEIKLLSTAKKWFDLNETPPQIISLQIFFFFPRWWFSNFSQHAKPFSKLT